MHQFLWPGRLWSGKKTWIYLTRALSTHLHFQLEKCSICIHCKSKTNKISRTLQTVNGPVKLEQGDFCLFKQLIYEMVRDTFVIFLYSTLYIYFEMFHLLPLAIYFVRYLKLYYSNIKYNLLDFIHFWSIEVN